MDEEEQSMGPGSRITPASVGGAGDDATAVAAMASSRMGAARITEDAASLACRRLLNLAVTRVDFPGGRARSSVRAVAAGGTYIVTRRKQATRAALEAGVLRELHAAGAPVPGVLAFDGEWLIQQDLGSARLSSALGVEAQGTASGCMARAADALLQCQQAARRVGLDRRVAPIGVKPEWISKLLAVPGQVARQLDLDDPAIGAVITPEQLAPRRLAFVKWDARPGNALLDDDGGVRWIDWEHCGARDALDDLAWLLCDEYMPDDEAVEAAVLDRFLPLFAAHAGRTPDDAQLYLSRMGTLHSCMRLLLVLKNKGAGDWWPSEACARTDRVGVTVQGAQRLCQRAARWAARWPGGARMQLFLANVGERLLEPPVDAIPKFASAELAHRNTPAAIPVPS